jgi:hypothetical protein
MNNKKQIDYLNNIYNKRILQEQRFTVLGPLLQEIQSPLATFNIPIELKSSINNYKGQYTTKSGRSLISFLTLDSNDDKKLQSIVSVYNFLVQKKYIGDLTVPFAEDGAGNYFCFQYKNNNDSNPSIVFWDHESSGGVSKEANSFKEFISGLKEKKQEEQNISMYKINPKHPKTASSSIMAKLKDWFYKKPKPITTVDIHGEKVKVFNHTSADGKSFDEKQIPEMIKLINKNYDLIINSLMKMEQNYETEWKRGRNITKETFIDKLKPEGIGFYSDGGAVLTFYDGSDLFMGHLIAITLEPKTMKPSELSLYG